MELVECKACGSKEFYEEGGAVICSYCQSRYVPIVGQAPSAESIQTAFDVVIESADKKKMIPAIKEIRELTGLGLKEAKDLAESLPRVLLTGVNRADADTAKARLERAGCVVTIR